MDGKERGKKGRGGEGAFFFFLCFAESVCRVFYVVVVVVFS